MAQFARPNADISNPGSYTVQGSAPDAPTSALWPQLDETTHNDGTNYIESPKNAASAQCTVDLTSITDPDSSSGHILRVWARASKSMSGGTCTAELWDETNGFIATATNTSLTTTWTEINHTLASGEADNISNYATLRIRFTCSSAAGGYIWITQAELQVPDATTQQSVGGAITPSGAYSRGITTSKAGTQTLTGDPASKTKRSLSAALRFIRGESVCLFNRCESSTLDTIDDYSAYDWEGTETGSYLEYDATEKKVGTKSLHATSGGTDNSHVSFTQTAGTTPQASGRVGLWARVSSPRSDSRLVFIHDSPQDNWVQVIIQSGNTVRFSVKGATTEYTLDSTNTVNDDEWIHIEAIWNSSTPTRQVYVNGSLWINSTASFTGPSSMEAIRIGRTNWSSGELWVDNVVIITDDAYVAWPYASLVSWNDQFLKHKPYSRLSSNLTFNPSGINVVHFNRCETSSLLTGDDYSAEDWTGTETGSEFEYSSADKQYGANSIHIKSDTAQNSYVYFQHVTASNLPQSSGAFGFWFKIPTSTAISRPLSIDDNMSQNWIVVRLIANRTIRLDCSVGGVNYDTAYSTQTFTDNAWHWLECRWDGSAPYRRVTVDNVLFVDDTNAFGGGFSALEYLRIGRIAWNSQDSEIYIDNVVISKDPTDQLRTYGQFESWSDINDLTRHTTTTLDGIKSFVGDLGTVFSGIVQQAVSGAMSFTGTAAKSITYSLAGVLSKAGSVTKKAFASVAGALTTNGAYLRAISKLATGVQALTGQTLRAIKASFASVLTSSGTVLRLIGVTRSGAASFAGAAQKAMAQTVDGAISFVGDYSKSAYKALAGALTTAGAFVRSVGSSVAGTLTTTGSFIRSVSSSAAGTLTTAGSALKQTAQTYAGTLTSSGSIGKTAQRILAGTLSSTGSIVRSVSLVLAGTLTSIGSYARNATTSLAGTLTTVGAQSRKTLRSIGGALSSAGTLLRSVQSTLAGSLSAAGSAIRSLRISSAGVLSSAGAVARKSVRSLSASIGFSSTISRSISTLYSGILTSSSILGTFFQGVTQKMIGGGLSLAGQATRKTTQTFAGVLTTAGAISKRWLLSVSGVLTSAAALTRSTGKAIGGTVTSSSQLLRGIAANLASVLTSSATLNRAIAVTRTATLSTTGAVRRSISVTWQGVLTTSGQTLRSIQKALVGSLTSASSLTRAIRVGVAGVLTSSGALLRAITASVAGTLTSAGAVFKAVSTALSGALSTAGSVATELLEEIQKALSGSLTTAGAITRKTTTSVAGAWSATGAVTRGFFQILAGSLEFAGGYARNVGVRIVGALTSFSSISRTTARVVTGAISTAGSIARSISTSFAATLTFVGNAGKGIAQAIEGTLTTAGSVSTELLEFLQKTVAGTLAATGAVTRKVTTSTAGVLTTAGQATKRIATSLGGVLTTAGSIATQLLEFFQQAVGGTLTSTGALTRSVATSLAGVFAPTGSIARFTQKIIAGVLTTAGALATAFEGLTQKALTATLSVAGSLTRRTQRGLAGTVTLSGQAVKALQRILDATLTTTGAITKSVGRAVIGTLTTAGSALRSVALSFTGTLAASGAISKQINRGLAASVSFAGSYARNISKSLSATLTSGSTLITNFQGIPHVLLTAALTTSGSAVRKISTTKQGTLTITGDRLAAINKLLDGLLTQLGSISTQTLTAVSKEVDVVWDLRQVASDTVDVQYDIAELAGKVVALVYSLLAEEEPVAITRQLRDALLADLQHISTQNGYSTDPLEVGKFPKPMREMRAPCIYITGGGSGESDIETIGNDQGMAVQRFNLIAAVRSSLGPEAMDNLLDDIRNCVERDYGNLYDLAFVVTVDSWGELLTDRDLHGEVFYRPISVKADYAYRRGAA